MSKRAVLLTGWVVLCCMPRVAPAAISEEQGALLREATQAFDLGMSLRRERPTESLEAFKQSAERYQKLVDLGIHNGKLYYNLGNACFESEQFGRAILNYRRAEQLMPRDPQLEANLNYARSLCRVQIPQSGGRALLSTLFAWHDGTAIQTRYLIGLIAYVVFWTLLVARVFRPQHRWRYALIPTSILWIVLGSSVAFELIVQRQQREGVIVTDDVTVRKGHDEHYDPQFEQPLHRGVEFRVLQTQGGWLQIELPDGQNGWIPARTAELI